MDGCDDKDYQNHDNCRDCYSCSHTYSPPFRDPLTFLNRLTVLMSFLMRGVYCLFFEKRNLNPFSFFLTSGIP